MTKRTANNRPSKGRFVKGVSGNPKGRPKGSSGHAVELLRLEGDAMELASNVADAICETAISKLIENGRPDLIQNIEAIGNAAKNAVREGEIGPSNTAVLRGWYDSHLERDQDRAFFVHIGLADDCSWEAFKSHYQVHGRTDIDRLGADLLSYPPIAERLKIEEQLAT